MLNFPVVMRSTQDPELNEVVAFSHKYFKGLNLHACNGGHQARGQEAEVRCYRHDNALISRMIGTVSARVINVIT